MKHANTYTLRILNSSPDTLPLARMALYLQEMANLLGARERVHFEKVVKSSASLRVWAEDGVADEVRNRVDLAINAPDKAPKEAVASLRKIDDLLYQDGKKAQLKNPQNVVIYPFPGSSRLRREPIVVEDDCAVIGQVIKIGGRDDSIPLLLVDSDGSEYQCTVMGKELAKEISSYYLGGPIEVSGRAKWKKLEDGSWLMDSLKVKSFTPLCDDWDEAFEHMTRLSAGWSDIEDVLARCAEIRRG